MALAKPGARNGVYMLRLPPSPGDPPAYSRDPIPENPDPPGTPGHESWEAATQKAKTELFACGVELFHEYPAEMQQLHLALEWRRRVLKHALRVVDIWAERTLVLVYAYINLRNYEYWLDNYSTRLLADV